jgi:cell division septation protein DedD
MMVQGVRKHTRVVASLALLFSACSTTKPTVPTPQFLAWSHNQPVARRICVLPFTDQTSTPGLAGQVRRSVAGHLSVKRFSDAELFEIDDNLEKLSGWKNQPAQQIGRTLGCDALLYGEVLRAGRLYLAVYSQLTLEGAIHLVDVATGQTLLKDSYTTRFRAAGVPLSPLAVVPSAVMNLNNLTDSQMVRAVDDLGRHLADKVPDLPVPLRVQYAPPVIQSDSAPSPSARETSQTLVEKDEKKPQVEVAALSAQKSSPRVASGHYRVEVAMFNSQSEAQAVARLLREKGYDPLVVELVGMQRSWHRVIVGPFSSAQEAQRTGGQIQQILPYMPVVMR